MRWRASRRAMLWFEITASVPPERVEAVSHLMREAAPGGLSIEEPVDILGPEMGFRVRGGEPVLVRAYLPSSELGAVLIEGLRRSLGALPAVELTARPIYEEDWAVSWREFFGVVETGGRVVVVPSWVEHEPAPGQVAVRIDPGQAFGTGHHETTRLMLAALDDLLEPGTSVLDVGTGSGILAIAAALLGAGRVEGLDVDPVAVEVARANCAANGVEADLSKGTLEPAHPRRYGLVLANISTEANVALAPAFAAVLEPGGRLAASGILAAQAPRVREAMAVAGLAFETSRFERDWCLLEFRKP
jgi:ribosomal protein L11 methyltransferase